MKDYVVSRPSYDCGDIIMTSDTLDNNNNIQNSESYAK